MGAVLLASEGQDGEWVQLQLRGDGPLGTVTVSANSEGRVRGFAAHPQADLPPTGNRFDVPGLLGLGALHVDRNHASWKRPSGRGANTCSGNTPVNIPCIPVTGSHTAIAPVVSPW